MQTKETLEILNLLAASESKVQIWMKLNGRTVELEHDNRPVDAADAIVMVECAHNLGADLGVIPTFHLRRWEW